MLDRRDFLGWLVVQASGAAVVLSGVGCGSARKPNLIVDAVDLAWIREVAQAYLGVDGIVTAEIIGRSAADAAEPAWDDLWILDHTAGSREIIRSHDEVEAAVAALRSAIRQDFIDLRIVSVEGWTLARTEVELCWLAWATAEPA